MKRRLGGAHGSRLVSRSTTPQAGTRGAIRRVQAVHCQRGWSFGKGHPTGSPPEWFYPFAFRIGPMSSLTASGPNGSVQPSGCLHEDAGRPCGGSALFSNGVIVSTRRGAAPLLPHEEYGRGESTQGIAGALHWPSVELLDHTGSLRETSSPRSATPMNAGAKVRPRLTPSLPPAGDDLRWRWSRFPSPKDRLVRRTLPVRPAPRRYRHESVVEL